MVIRHNLARTGDLTDETLAATQGLDRPKICKKSCKLLILHGFRVVRIGGMG